MLYTPVQPMHIPDGFLSTLVSVVFWAISAIAVAYALRRVGKDLGERQVPLMGVLAAAIFAGQMLNFSVAGGATCSARPSPPSCSVRGRRSSC